MAEGKAAAVIARLGQISRELADRRALRERRASEARQRASDSLQKQGKVAERAAKHLGELGRRQKEAGGWVTEKALADKDKVMGFGPEEDEQPDEFARYTGYSSAPPPPPSPPQADAQAQAEPQERKYSRSVAPPPPPEPEPAPAPPPRRAPRHARREQSFDDDDFSNNSWLT
ncbi:hypothetical protein [Prauserella muralis]|uniref:Uncharacterized protein n=1 Tax=Prauserella muralis TaxID=588067 RepID=A0A2V4BNM4_9PSEU|nr:hypothetical protein [Prauserella muralis]PXY32223.1 hypothetical protein BAY60_08020 [Prauserella muralis]TWE24114.1 hypothetical protein FHX69_5421 [Prauserella muralis]